MVGIPPLVWLDDVTEALAPHVGGKAAGLARLRRAGLPVPDGFVVLAGDADPAVLDAACARLGASVAVRSSSVAEDTAEASFAGQYRTELDVQGASAVRAAVARVRSATPHAALYAAAVGATARPPAVLVQKFVEPRAAGVVFTRDPFDPTAILVEAHAGRGDAVVSGTVAPHRTRLDRASGAVRDGADGILDAGALQRLLALSRRAEELFGGPQDVEWALGDAELVLLQSRPITVEAERTLDPRVRRLTRANVGEVLPDPVTPLTATTVVAILEHAFRATVERVGLGVPGGPPFLVVHNERLYLNLGLSLEIASRLPGIRAGEAERLVLGEGTVDAPPPGGGPGAWLRLALVGVRASTLDAQLPREIATAEEVLDALRRHTRDVSEPAELARAFGEFLAAGGAIATTHVSTSGASAVRLGVLGRLLERWVGGDATSRIGRLMAGLDGVASAAPSLALEAIAETAPADPAAALRPVLEAYGHRGLSEGELHAPSWREDPRPLLDALQALVAASRPAALSHRAAASAREAEMQATLFRLGPWRRAILRRAIAAAQEWVRARERTKSLAVALVDEGRRLARRAGERLAAQGALDAPDDVFFLEAEELGRALAGEAPSRAVVRRRRRRHAAAGSVPAPRLVDLTMPSRPAEAAATWRGLGVSGGVGVGRVRIARAGETPRVASGEVLVASVLDAAFGPALAAASAAVAEMGGILSHGAVVARELGIPCVVDLRDATTTLRDGERVLVDGGTGEVRRLEEDSSSPSRVAASADLPRAAPADEAFHVLPDHASARESVYLNAQDPRTGLRVVSSVGVRRGRDGEALLALRLPDGRQLFAVERGPAAVSGSNVRVGPAALHTEPVFLHWRGRLLDHDGPGPPPPLPLLFAPRLAEVDLQLRMEPTTPAVDLVAALDPGAREALARLAGHHVEQSGRIVGTIRIDGVAYGFAGTGSRDHSWGLREWDAAEWWRLFTVRLGDELAVHALVTGVAGRRVEGGFLWRSGRIERLARVVYAPRADPRRFDLEVVPVDGAPLRLVGTVEGELAVPVDPERRPLPHLAGRPWRLVLHERFTRYDADGRTGHGMAEITERSS